MVGSVPPRCGLNLKLQLQKLRHGMERLIDSLAEGVIDRDQFTTRMDRTKIRIVEIEAKLGAQETGEGRRAHVQALMRRLGELSSHIKSQLSDPDWAARREIISAIVQNCTTHRDSVVSSQASRLATESTNRRSQGSSTATAKPPQTAAAKPVR